MSSNKRGPGEPRRTACEIERVGSVIATTAGDSGNSSNLTSLSTDKPSHFVPFPSDHDPNSSGRMRVLSLLAGTHSDACESVY